MLSVSEKWAASFRGKHGDQRGDDRLQLTQLSFSSEWSRTMGVRAPVAVVMETAGRQLSAARTQGVSV